MFKHQNSNFTFCNFFIINEIFILSNYFSICFRLFLTHLFWILMRKKNVVTFFLFLFFDVKNWFSDVQNSWKAIDDWESFKSLLLEESSESLETEICDLNWLKLLVCDEFFIIEIELFSSRCDCCIILKTECLIYFVDILLMQFNLFYCLKFSFVFLMFFYVILSENMFKFSF